MFEDITQRILAKKNHKFEDIKNMILELNLSDLRITQNSIEFDFQTYSHKCENTGWAVFNTSYEKFTKAAEAVFEIEWRSKPGAVSLSSFPELEKKLNSRIDLFEEAKLKREPVAFLAFLSEKVNNIKILFDKEADDWYFKFYGSSLFLRQKDTVFEEHIERISDCLQGYDLDKLQKATAEYVAGKEITLPKSKNTVLNDLVL